jgi:hypothetical protein
MILQSLNIAHININKCVFRHVPEKNKKLPLMLNAILSFNTKFPLETLTYVYCLYATFYGRSLVISTEVLYNIYLIRTQTLDTAGFLLGERQG